MNNKPVAWTDGKGNYFDKNSFFPVDDLIPLYTHPAKELGYNDIMGTWWETIPNAKNCEGIFEFARAILKKAQEK